MRLFQQVAILPKLTPNPPFLPDQEGKKGVTLLRESTMHLREGRRRVPTPKRAAILQLSSSFEKRRLRRQQQMLTDIAQRCREQEVTDLSSKLTTRLGRDKAGTKGAAALSRLQITASIPAAARPAPGDRAIISGASLQSIDLRESFEQEYKYFPARKIMRRQPTRLALYLALTDSSSKPDYHSVRNTLDSTSIGGAGTPSFDNDGGLGTVDLTPNVQRLSHEPFYRNRNRQIRHCTSPELDPVAVQSDTDTHGPQRYPPVISTENIQDARRMSSHGQEIPVSSKASEQHPLHSGWASGEATSVVRSAYNSQDHGPGRTPEPSAAGTLTKPEEVPVNAHRDNKSSTAQPNSPKSSGPEEENVDQTDEVLRRYDQEERDFPGDGQALALMGKARSKSLDEGQGHGQSPDNQC